MANVPRIFIFLLALGGVVGVFPIVERQVMGVASCPSAGLVPACYVVLLGYGLIALSAFFDGKRRFWVFMTGWLPILGLAAAGSALQFLRGGTCPSTSGGVPTCYLSLILLLVLAGIYFVERRYAGHSSANKVDS